MEASSRFIAITSSRSTYGGHADAVEGDEAIRNRKVKRLAIAPKKHSNCAHVTVSFLPVANSNNK